MNEDNAIVESGAERKWLAVDAAARFYLRAVGETSAAADLTDSRVLLQRRRTKWEAASFDWLIAEATVTQAHSSD